jgi:hypothetical protein
LLYYFWISVFDKILIENIPYGWFSKWSGRIKLIILGFLATFSIIYFGYIDIKVMKIFRSLPLVPPE